MIGKSVPRVDAYEKVTGRAKFTEDLIPPRCLVAKVLHASIGKGIVTSIDTSEAEALEGVVKVVTFKDVPEHCYPTPGHPWSVEPAHQDVADRNLLTGRVRYYGDDIAAVVAEDEITAARALKLIKVEYEEYPVEIQPRKSMQGSGLRCMHLHLRSRLDFSCRLRRSSSKQHFFFAGPLRRVFWMSGNCFTAAKFRW